MDNKQNIIGLIGTSRYLVQSYDQFPLEYEYHVRDFDIDDYILELMGFPKDTTIELGLDKGFCQDYLIMIIHDKNNTLARTYRMLVGELKQLEDSNKDGE